jgi:hypothetical protein
MHMQSQSTPGCRDLNATTEKLQLILVFEASTGTQWLTIELHGFVSAERLNKRGAIEQVQQHDRTTTGPWQA